VNDAEEKEWGSKEKRSIGEKKSRRGPAFPFFFFFTPPPLFFYSFLPPFACLAAERYRGT
jgi:hypothetical protein